MRMKKFLAMLFAVGMALSASVAILGCETTKGAGEDIENLGEGMEDAVD